MIEINTYVAILAIDERFAYLREVNRFPRPESPPPNPEVIHAAAQPVDRRIRILTKHGKHARAAFAMTFIANNHGVVYQKNCGASAQPLANPIRRMLSNRSNQSKESP